MRMIDNSDGEQSAPADRREELRLPNSIQGHLGRQLRTAYALLVHEPVPDRLVKLLETLEAAEKKL